MQQDHSIDIHDIWDKVWRDKRGHVIIWQMPNMWLMSWAVLTTLSLFFNANSTMANILSAISSISLLIWSLLEIFKGVNYFRRTLGLGVLILATASFIKSF